MESQRTGGRRGGAEEHPQQPAQATGREDSTTSTRLTPPPSEGSALGQHSFHPATMIRDMIDQQVLELKKLWANKRQLTFQLLNLAMIVFSALMIWKGLMFLTKVGSIHISLVRTSKSCPHLRSLGSRIQLMHPWRRGLSMNT